MIDPRKLWSMEDVAEYGSYGISHVKKIVAQPDFPRPIRVFEGSHPRWVAGKVMEWFEARESV